MERDLYLKQLLSRMGNGLIKVITGIRRCGKSYLVFTLFRNHLLKECGVPPERIIALALDDDINIKQRNPLHLGKYIRERVTNDSERFYVLIDEIQYCHRIKNVSIDEKLVAPEERDSLYITFYDVLNGLLRLKNVDIYVTGSNSKMLSDDVKTIFRGRGDEIRIHPFSFSEYLACVQGDKLDAWEDYMVYGGMPLAVLEKNTARRRSYLTDLYEEVYLKDLVERNDIRNLPLLESLLDTLSSSIGSLTNPTRLANTINSLTGQKDTTANTVELYIRYLMQAFLFGKAKQYDIKGKKYLETPYKLYSEDVGVRNARLNWRQQERTHLMENIIYNELVRLGYAVDVGIVNVETRKEGVREIHQHEIDFVINQGFERIYIQSAFAMETEEKRDAELLPFRHCRDSFLKVIVSGGNEKLWKDEEGVAHIGILPFLLDASTVLPSP
ncbi:MAG: ATP-binding protein [Victivallales bacterium]|nr:ATP-binding protein [Victivallales bacterium]